MNKQLFYERERSRSLRKKIKEADVLKDSKSHCSEWQKLRFWFCLLLLHVIFTNYKRLCHYRDAAPKRGKQHGSMECTCNIGYTKVGDGYQMQVDKNWTFLQNYITHSWLRNRTKTTQTGRRRRKKSDSKVHFTILQNQTAHSCLQMYKL